MQNRERGDGEHAQDRRSDEVAARDRQRVAEQEALDSRRRRRRKPSRTPRPNSVVITIATAVSRPTLGTVAASATASAAPPTPNAAPSSERQPEQRRDHEPGEHRVSQRLGAVRELVEDDPAPERAGERADHRQLECRPAA